MIENTEMSVQPEQVASPLPDIRKFRKNFAQLDLGWYSEEKLNRIFNWWRDVKKRNEYFGRLKAATDLEGVPKLEKTDSKKDLEETRIGYDVINASINAFIEHPKTTLKDAIRRIFQGIYTTPPEIKQAITIADAIEEYLSTYDLENEQIIAVCEAISETRDLGQSEEIIRQKIAQHGFEEMMTIFPYYRFAYLYEAGEEPTTVDHLESEKSELISAIKGELWTGKERRKYRSIFKRFRKMMDRLEFETEVKTGFNFVFDLAIGEASLSRNSAIEILKRIEDVWFGIQEDSTLKEAWEYELEQEEESEEESEDVDDDEKDEE